jgi:serine/threonine protein phosphatase 1
MTGRTIAIGDIHGCSAALAALLDAVAPGPDDMVVALGDYIDRGPNSRDVIEILLDLADRCRLVPLLGNHEEMLFAALEGRSDRDYWLRFGGDATLRSYGVDDPKAIPSRHLAFLKGCRPFHETDTHIFVHANCSPNLSLANQSSTTRLWEHLNVMKAAPHFSGKTVVVGHTPQKDGRILDLGFLTCIDTDCCNGGWLTALEVDTGHYWQANQEGEVRVGRTGQIKVS